MIGKCILIFIRAAVFHHSSLGAAEEAEHVVGIHKCAYIICSGGYTIYGGHRFYFCASGIIGVQNCFDRSAGVGNKLWFAEGIVSDAANP